LRFGRKGSHQASTHAGILPRLRGENVDRCRQFCKSVAAAATKMTRSGAQRTTA
jgi:hypothetical protein